MYGLEGILGNLVTSVATPAIGGLAGEAVSKGVEDQLLKEITQTTVGALSGAAVGAGLGALTGGKSGALSGALTGGVGGGVGGYNAPQISQMFGMNQSVGAPQGTQLQPQPQQSPMPPVSNAQLAQQDPVGALLQPNQSSAQMNAVRSPIPGPQQTSPIQDIQTPVPSPSAPSGFKGYMDFLKQNYEPLAGGFFLGSAYGANQDTQEQSAQSQQQQTLKNMMDAQNARRFSHSAWGYADGGNVERPYDAAIKRLLETGPSIYGSQEHNIEKRPLNVQNLIDAGAMRITYPGDGRGSYDPNLEGYSIVSRINDVGDPMTRGWPDKPDAYGDAAKSLANPDMLKQLSDAKYKQLIDSAAAAGLAPKDIYANYADGGPVEVGLANPQISVHFPAWAQEDIQREGGLAALQPGMKQGMANGGYVNTQPFNPQDFHPQSRIPSAQPYLAAGNTGVLNTLTEGASFGRGGLIDGAGDGMSDDIPANISGREEVRVADGEYVIPKEIAAKYGPDKLKRMMAKVRAAAHAKKGKQIVQGAAQREFIKSLTGVKA